MDKEEAKILRRALEYADNNDSCKITSAYGVEYLEALKVIGYVKIDWNRELTDFGRITLSKLRADEWR